MTYQILQPILLFLEILLYSQELTSLFSLALVLILQILLFVTILLNTCLNIYAVPFGLGNLSTFLVFPFFIYQFFIIHFSMPSSSLNQIVILFVLMIIFVLHLGISRATLYSFLKLEIYRQGK